jgi:hypothetical protein
MSLDWEVLLAAGLLVDSEDEGDKFFQIPVDYLPAVLC